MLSFPRIDPVAVAIGPLKVHWYGLMYMIGIGGAWWLARRRAQDMTGEQVDDLAFYVAVGLVLGGRIGYVLFYNLPAFVLDPLLIFRVWEGGMSFHGGLLGALVGAGWCARRHNLGFFMLTDLGSPLVPIGLFAGRIGNFINGELWGKATDLPWGMIFPDAGSVPRHPSQLYEALLEGALLFTVLNLFVLDSRPRMAPTGLFLLGYGLCRFGVEFVREPDAQIGYLAGGWLTMGMLLTLPMIAGGAVLLFFAYRRSP
ncbi:MAG TPA: prolipoprotein diacylglyceryl transferase [Methylococcaceae bacterium]|nr:prolipoprotein diacylglyceryl transferase [Methylococcaceae bacterium]